MNTIDITALVILIFFGFKGYSTGLIRALFSLAGMILASYVAFVFNNEILPLLPLDIRSLEGITILGPFVAFLAVLLLSRLVGILLTKSLKPLSLSTVNRILGLLFGLLKGLFFVFVLVGFSSILISTLNFDLPEVLSESLAYLAYNYVLDYIN
jgi:membrane protein required for colicin V production